ncbi:phage replication protein [Pseudomonas sp. ABC1]|uniref:phage replication protein n=1 Tax=Pseudomonas sp. ABC1 TaxID=2748080 RepID=UPI0015C2D2EF|nr:phage replication protein [Pseudomonas sp. ABC1]QLF92284.1 phage replication protein [Pseudomonas sp. ABC1]
MARARNIKPSIMANEDLVELDPFERLLFIYLWMLADREGRLEDRPKRIKAEALPYDSVDADLMLDNLARAGFILRYDVDGVKLIQVLNFAKHQTPHVREQASNLPGFAYKTAAPEQSSAKVVPEHIQGSDEPSPRSPDSLIPDSLIPDTREEHVQTGQAGQDVPAPEQISSEGQGKVKPATPKPDPLEGFDQFYRLYPKRQKRADAEKAWRKLNTLQRQAAMAALPKHCQQPDWLKDAGQFVPLPASWLNGKRWEDELSTQNTHHPPSRFTDLDQIDHEAGLEQQPDGTYRIARQRA